MLLLQTELSKKVQRIDQLHAESNAAVEAQSSAVERAEQLAGELRQLQRQLEEEQVQGSQVEGLHGELAAAAAAAAAVDAQLKGKDAQVCGACACRPPTCPLHAQQLSAAGHACRQGYPCHRPLLLPSF